MDKKYFFLIILGVVLAIVLVGLVVYFGFLSPRDRASLALSSDSGEVVSNIFPLGKPTTKKDEISASLPHTFRNLKPGPWQINSYKDGYCSDIQVIQLEANQEASVVVSFKKPPCD